MRNSTLILFLLITAMGAAQDLRDRDYREKRLKVRDTLVLDTVSINRSFFEVRRSNNSSLDTSYYRIDYGNAVFYVKSGRKIPGDSLTFRYRVYPEFLTKRYFQYDRSRIVNSTGKMEQIYSLAGERKATAIKPFDGLVTSGSIVRGATVGSNQNSTLNSELDLQISGQLSDKVSLRASIQDANIPQVEGGYSQSLDEFDQIFIELYSDAWNIRAGDINLQNSSSYFGRFTKKVQGLSLSGILEEGNAATDLFATGALVRGVFTQSRFTGQEGNQGPYKLTGPSGELYVLIISGSERVYVNGVLLNRGETEDYMIDYNAGELRFNPTFPITSEMRISVEYQYSEQNFTRVIAYAGGGHKTNDNTLSLQAHVYSESDAKNQPLQQNLNAEQVAILQEAGDDRSEMIAPSASPDTFSDNKILYRKEVVEGREIFVFSNDPVDELFNVRFSRVGPNQGNYILSSSDATSRIYEYVSPVNGIPQGNFAPVVQLFAPVKLQMAVVQGAYIPSEKTAVSFEGAGSKRDLNLFSDLDDADNDGFAGRIRLDQQIFNQSNARSLQAFATVDYIQEDFQNIERTYEIEFSRDWNLPLRPLGNQSLISSGLRYADTAMGNLDYRYESLNYSGTYSGNRHNILGNLKKGDLRAFINGSFLTTKADTLTSDFLRFNGNAIYGLGKNWIGTKIGLEDNVSRNPISRTFDPLSQRFQAYEGFAGLGDSTGVFVELGYRYRINDSLRNNKLERVNHSNTYYLKSQLFKNENTSLGLFVNYRTLIFNREDREHEQSLNSRLIYDQKFFKNLLRWNTVFETSSGTLPQQEFTFVNVDEGQGTHTWNDYNGDGIKQLQEFEIAQFKDEADYIRVLLPNQIFVKTHRNKLSQLLIFNLQQWTGQSGFKKFASHFYNQTSYLIDRRIRREGGDFDINPFAESDKELGLNLNFRNTLFFNRGRQNYTTSYTYLATTTKNLLSVGLQENRLRSHQLNFLHKVQKQYLINFTSEIGTNSSNSENFSARNFDLNTFGFQPRLSYLFSDQSRVELFYAYGEKDNLAGNREQLQQQNLGFEFTVTAAEKISLNGELKYINNAFDGSPFSPVAYQMLEGLQPGSNFTWNLLAQRRITKFLDLNVSYFGRKSETSSTIHTGTVQLRAFF